MKKLQKMKRRLFEIITIASSDDPASRAFEIGIIGLIVVNVILVIADTFSLPPSLVRASSVIELFSLAVFTIEYACRLLTADLLYPDLPPLKARIRYVFSFMALVDLFAILPFYIPYVIRTDLRVLRMLRLIRLSRVFKINRYTSALSSIASVFRRKKNQLLSSIYVVSLLIIVASVLMYNVEHDAQPQAFSNIFSALWWAVATLTTVGYGDIYPITTFGKILSAIIAVLGIGLVAIPTGIISAGFMENIESRHSDEKHYCPYCGKKLK